jgi:hypothetical protein
MQHSPVADVAILFHNRVLARKAMHATAILQVAALFHKYAAHVSAKRSVRAYITERSHDHVADQYGTRVNVRALSDNGSDSVDGVDMKH